MLKAQSAMEFIILASFMLVVLLVFFSITSSKIIETQESNNRKIAQDIAEFAYREIEIAKSVNDGYTRVFTMPQTVNAVDYKINITGNRELIVDYMGYEFVKFLPANVTGNITAGDNNISKENGFVFLNPRGFRLS